MGGKKIDRTPRQWVKFKLPSPEKLKKACAKFMKERKRQ